jgi:hypothetical protein
VTLTVSRSLRGPRIFLAECGDCNLLHSAVCVALHNAMTILSVQAFCTTRLSSLGSQPQWREARLRDRNPPFNEPRFHSADSAEGCELHRDENVGIQLGPNVLVGSAELSLGRTFHAFSRVDRAVPGATRHRWLPPCNALGDIGGTSGPPIIGAPPWRFMIAKHRRTAAVCWCACHE